MSVADPRLPLSSLLYDNDVGQRVYRVLPYLNNAHPTIPSWVEVVGESGESVIVLSIPATKFLLHLYDPTLQDVDVEGFLMCSFDRDNMPGRMPHSDFARLLQKTPFKMFRNSSATTCVAGKNFDMYVIMRPDYWSEVLFQIKDEFEEEGLVEFTNNARVPSHAMIRRACTL